MTAQVVALFADKAGNALAAIRRHPVNHPAERELQRRYRKVLLAYQLDPRAPFTALARVCDMSIDEYIHQLEQAFDYAKDIEGFK